MRIQARLSGYTISDNDSKKIWVRKVAGGGEGKRERELHCLHMLIKSASAVGVLSQANEIKTIWSITDIMLQTHCIPNLPYLFTVNT